MLRVECLEDPDQLFGYLDDWADLHERSPLAEPFNSPEWITSWLEAFWKDRPTAFFFIWNDRQLVGLVPMLEDESGDLWCPHSLVNPVNSQGPRASVLLEGEATEPVVESVLGELERLGRRTRVALKNLPVGSPIIPSLSRGADAHGMGWACREETSSLIVDLEGDWETYLAGRTKHVRSEIRRKRKRFSEAGRAALRIASDVESVKASLQQIKEVERESWKEKEGSSITAGGDVEGFFEVLTVRLAAKGSVRIYVLDLDDRPVAHAVCAVARQDVYALKTSYGTDWAHLSPGAVLMGHVIEDAFKQRFRALDFMGAPEAWKQQLATRSRGYVSVCLSPKWSPRCGLCRTMESTVKPLARRKAPGLLRGKRWMQKALMWPAKDRRMTL